MSVPLEPPDVLAGRVRCISVVMSLAFFASHITGSTVSTGHAEQAPPASRSVSDGVYSARQAMRGSELYDWRCNACHGLRLEGDSGPALGPDFFSFWDGKPVSDLVAIILETMPADTPGVLSRQDASDIVAFMLKMSNYPEGGNELPPAVEIQRQILFRKPRK